MKKFLIAAMMILSLTSCSNESFSFDKATVVDKNSNSHPCGRGSICNSYIITVDVNGSQYSIPTNEAGYIMVSKGSVISVDYSGTWGFATIKPAVK